MSDEKQPQATKASAADRPPTIVIQQPSRNGRWFSRLLLVGLVASVLVNVSLYSLYSNFFVSMTGPIERFHRSEEHTSELQSRRNLVCRLLLEKKKKI